MVFGGMSGSLVDGVGQDTGGQVTIQMRMLCLVIGLKGTTIRGLHSPLPLAHAQNVGLLYTVTQTLILLN